MGETDQNDMPRGARAKGPAGLCRAVRAVRAVRITRITRITRIAIAVASLAALASLQGSCLSIEQGPCEAGTALCVENAVWVCRDDGSGWEHDVQCPGACEEGRCVLVPPPAWDAVAADAVAADAVRPPDGGSSD